MRDGDTAPSVARTPIRSGCRLTEHTAPADEIKHNTDKENDQRHEPPF
jgi:hypothetical protein